MVNTSSSNSESRQVANAAGLARIVQRVGQSVGARVEIVIVLRFVDAHAPQHNRRVVPVAPDHLAYVANRDILPRLVANVLPARNLLENQQAQFVAGVEKRGRLRIVRSPHDIAVQFPPQDPGIPALHTRRHRAAHVGKRLVPVQAAQFHGLAVEHEAGGRVARLAEADSGVILVPRFSVRKPHHHVVQLRVLQAPQVDFRKRLQIGPHEIRPRPTQGAVAVFSTFVPSSSSTVSVAPACAGPCR